MTQFKEQFKAEYGDKDEWQTPDGIYDILNRVFEFTVDAAATSANTKCKRYWDIESNGLAGSWRDEIVFCNPPYTKGQYGEWIEKAAEEFVSDNVTSVLVLPFKAETAAFNGVWELAKYLIIPYSRIKFVPAPDYIPPPSAKKGQKPSATFHSCIAVFTLGWLGNRQAKHLNKIGYVLNLDKGLVSRQEQTVFTTY